MSSYFYDYCEPSEEEIFLNELKRKFREILHEDIKTELERLTKENAELRETVQEYNRRELTLAEKEIKLQCRSENLKREVEREFYSKTMEEVFEQLLEDSEVWYAEYVPHEKPKCGLCNEERQMIATYPNGEVIKKPCSCAIPTHVYEPIISENRQIKFHKTWKPRYGSDKKCYFTKNYKPNKDHAEAYDYYGEFRIENIYDEFNEDVKTYHKAKRYSERIAFRNKEACQEYCDWLNSKKSD